MEGGFYPTLLEFEEQRRWLFLSCWYGAVLHLVKLVRVHCYYWLEWYPRRRMRLKSFTKSRFFVGFSTWYDDYLLSWNGIEWFVCEMLLQAVKTWLKDLKRIIDTWFSVGYLSSNRDQHGRSFIGSGSKKQKDHFCVNFVHCAIHCGQILWSYSIDDFNCKGYFWKAKIWNLMRSFWVNCLEGHFRDNNTWIRTDKINSEQGHSGLKIETILSSGTKYSVDRLLLSSFRWGWRSWTVRRKRNRGHTWYFTDSWGLNNDSLMQFFEGHYRNSMLWLLSLFLVQHKGNWQLFKYQQICAFLDCKCNKRLSFWHKRRIEFKGQIGHSPDKEVDIWLHDLKRTKKTRFSVGFSGFICTFLGCNGCWDCFCKNFCSFLNKILCRNGPLSAICKDFVGCNCTNSWKFITLSTGSIPGSRVVVFYAFFLKKQSGIDGSHNLISIIYSVANHVFYHMHNFGTVCCHVFLSITRYYHCHTCTAHFADYDPSGESAGPVMRLYSQGFTGSPRELVPIAGSRGHRATPVGTGPDVTGPYGASGCAPLLREFISHSGDERSETRSLRGSGELSDRGPLSDRVACVGFSLLVIIHDDRERHILTMMTRILMAPIARAATRFYYFQDHLWGVIWRFCWFFIRTESMELMRVYSQSEQKARDFCRTELELMRDHCHFEMELIEMVLMRDYCQIEVELLRDYMEDYYIVRVHLEIGSERTVLLLFRLDTIVYRLASWTWIWAWIGWAQSDII
ncbi:hypothetical protein LXL04_005501 [Taraxacum kok-saghyz]